METMKIRGLRIDQKSTCFKDILLKATLICIALLSNSSFAQSNEYFVSNDTRINIKEFDKKINEILKETGVPGTSIAIIENNKVAYANAYGFKDVNEQSKVEKNTLFEICSFSKIYLLYAVMNLVEEDVIDLDKPLYQYAPNKRLAYDDRYKLITSKMIINHTSGIENWQSYNDPNKLEILHDPGTNFLYSGEGYNYLAEVITSIVKEPYEDYIKRLVLKPLDLEDNIVMNYTKNNISNHSRGYNLIGQEVTTETKEVLPASSIHTTANDFSKMFIALLDNKHLSTSSVEYILEEVQLIADFQDAGKLYIGNGFMNFNKGEEEYVAFLGDNSGFKGQLFYSIKAKRGFVFLSNSDMGNVIAKRLNDLTTQFDTYDFLYPLYFSDMEEYLNLQNLYLQKGEQALFSFLQKKGDQLNWSNMRLLTNFLYNRDKIAAEKLSKLILTYQPDSAFSNFIIGAVNLRYHHDFELAKNYFIKAKEMSLENIDVDFYIKLCDENQLSRRF